MEEIPSGGFGFDSGGGSMDISPSSGSTNGDFMGGSMGSQYFNFAKPYNGESTVSSLLNNNMLLFGVGVVVVVMLMRGR